ncbi:MAG: glutamate 5-kinase [Endomicrobiia bacterium]
MNYKRIVIKVGSHLIIEGSKFLFSSLASQIKKIKDKGIDVIIVSSGAIATGVLQYNLPSKPKSIVEKQAYAAIGQPLLMNKYISAFKKYNIKVAQILLTREDFEARERYLNVRNTLNYLLRAGVVPVINENDTVATEEIKLGDNDNLSAIVASKIDADLLILLTDVDGIYEKNPKIYPNSKVIEEVKDINDLLSKCEISSKSNFFCGTGGMKTKLEAAHLCSLAGIDTVVANGLKENIILEILEGKKVGTYIYSKNKKLLSKKKWIAFAKKSKGKILIDSGAVVAITKKHKSLLPVGIKKVEGVFRKGDVVSVVSENGEEVARGITNYNSEEIEKMMGKKTQEIKKIIFNFETEEVIHADNLVILS